MRTNNTLFCYKPFHNTLCKKTAYGHFNFPYIVCNRRTTQICRSLKNKGLRSTTMTTMIVIPLVLTLAKK